MLVKNTALILQKVPFKEFDLIFMSLMSTGERESFYVRNAFKSKKFNLGLLEIGNFINIVYFKGKKFNYPKEISLDLERYCTFQYKNLENLNFYSRIIKITNILSYDFNSSELFDFVSLIFKQAQTSKNLLPIYNRFLYFCLQNVGCNLDDIESLDYLRKTQYKDKDLFIYYSEKLNKIFFDETSKIDLKKIIYNEKFKKAYLEKLFKQKIKNF